MRSVSMARIPKNKLAKVIGKIPFFKRLQSVDTSQFGCLLQYCKLSIAESGEVICRKGDFDSILYFLLKGRLQVYLQAPEPHVKPVSSVFPGEMFGTLAFVRDSERNATVKVDHSGDKAVLLGVDFSPFGELDDFSIISQSTKQFLYSSIAEDTRSHLHRFRHAFPGDPFVAKLSTIKSVDQAADTYETLEHTYRESIALAQLLNDWNTRVISMEHTVPGKTIADDIVKDVDEFLFQNTGPSS